MKKSKIPKISLVRRCASQRSTQAKIVRVRRMLNTAKVRSTSTVHGNNSGRAIVIPMPIASSQSEPIEVDGSNNPYASRTKKYDLYVRGKRRRLDDSRFSVIAVAMMGKNCQNSITGQKSAANHSPLFSDMKI